MKKIQLAIGLAAVIALPAMQADLAGTVLIQDAAGGNAGTGGPFMATIQTGGGGVVGSPFRTFCLELNEYLTLGGTYNYSIGPDVEGGGVGGPSPDPISAATAWLYVQYRGLSESAQQSEGASYQEAIWYLEEELDSVTGNALTLATTALTHNSGSAADYGVVALNLYGGSSANAEGLNQSMIGIVPEPTTVLAGALLLIPFGLSAARMMRRNSQV